MQEQILCVSYFDQIIGPSRFYCSEPLKNSKDAPDLDKILEFVDEEGFFIFAFRKYQSLNYLFYIDSELARGGKDLLMVSYLIKASYFKNEIANVFKFLESRKPLIKEYVSEIREIKELPEILHASKKASLPYALELTNEEFKNDFVALNTHYLEKLYPHNELDPLKTTNGGLKKIFILGGRGAGKTTLLKNLEVAQFHSQKNRDLPTRIYEIIIDNLDIITYDCIKREFSCKKCENYGGCMYNSQGFILMFDLSQEGNLQEARKQLSYLTQRCEEIEDKKLPILIIGNKIDGIEAVSEEKVQETLDMQSLKSCGIKTKYYPLNIQKEEKDIMKALRWLVRHMI